MNCGTVVKVTGKTVHVVEDFPDSSTSTVNGEVIKFTYRSRKDAHKMAGTRLYDVDHGHLRPGAHKFVKFYNTPVGRKLDAIRIRNQRIMNIRKGKKG